MKEFLIIVITVNLFAIILIIKAAANNNKLPSEFLQFLSKYNLKIKSLKKELLILLNNNSYETLIFTEMQRITLQCEDFNLTPVEFIEKEILDIKRHKKLSIEEKKITMNVLILGCFHLIKEYEEIYDELNNKTYNKEIINEIINENQ